MLHRPRNLRYRLRIYRQSTQGGARRYALSMYPPTSVLNINDYSQPPSPLSLREKASVPAHIAQFFL